jgi:hypothetical protein
MVTAAENTSASPRWATTSTTTCPTTAAPSNSSAAASSAKSNAVHVWKTSESKGLGAPPDAPPPACFDYETWLGPAPRRAFNPNRSHFNYRYFWDYSGGMFIDFWCHITDVAYWALDLTAPKSVVATGRREIEDDNAETPNYLDLVYEYPGLNLTWGLNPMAPAALKTKASAASSRAGAGSLFVDYGSHQLFVKGKPRQRLPPPRPLHPRLPRPHPRVPRQRQIPQTRHLRHRIRPQTHQSRPARQHRLPRPAAASPGTTRKNRSSATPRPTKWSPRKYRKPWKLA